MKSSELKRLQKIEKRIYEIARENGLEFCDIEFDVIPADKMFEIMAYNMPGQISNWKFGRDYERTRTIYEHLDSLPYEVVVNTDPARAYLMKDNTLALQALIIAHVVGHCFKGETKIETIDGEKRIDKVEIGDLVYTHKGRFRKVINKGRRIFKENIKKVKIKGYNDYIYVTPNHEFFSIKSQKCVKAYRKNVICKPTCSYVKDKRCAKKNHIFKDYQLNWNKIGNLNVGDFISFPKEKLESIKNNKLNINIDKILHKQHITGEWNLNIDSDFSRLIGYMIADGGIRETDCFLYFNINEDDLKNDVENIIKNIFELKPKVQELRKKENVLSVGFYNKELSTFFLEEIGHLPENKKIPDFIYYSDNKNVIINCLKGIFLGDGSIRKSYKNRKSSSFEITTVSNKLAYQIRRMLSRLDVQTSFHVKKESIGSDGVKRQKNYNILISGESVHKLSDYFFNEDLLKGNRSFTSNGYGDENYIYKKIEKIENVNFNDYVYNIEVEEDNSYVLSIGSIVHNCAFFTMNKYHAENDSNIASKLSAASERFDDYEKKYGIDMVEQTVDAGHALMWHSNPWFPEMTEEEKLEKIFERMKKKKHDKTVTEFGDMFEDDSQADIDREKWNNRLYMTLKNKTPIQPTEDLLRYIIDHSRHLTTWQKDILETIRSWGQYIWPNIKTKYINEGFACIVPSSLVHTEKGFVTIEYAEGYCNKVIGINNTLTDIDQRIVTKEQPTIKIKTNTGLELEGAELHRILVNINGEEKDVHLKDINIGDYVCMSVGVDIWPTKNIQIENKKRKKRIFKKEVNIPSEIDEDLAYLFGSLIAEGSFYSRKFQFHNSDMNYINRIKTIIENKFHITPKLNEKENSGYILEVSSVLIMDFLKKSGIDLVNQWEREIPWSILRSPKNIMSSFIAGFFDGDGSFTSSNHFNLASSSEKLIRQFAVVLLNYGVVGSWYVSKKEGYEDSYQLRISNGNCHKILYNEIPFYKDKDSMMKSIDKRKFFHKVKNICTVISIEHGSSMNYDWHIPEGNHYVAQGFINHNTYWHEKILRQLFKEGYLNADEHAECNYSNSLVKAKHPHSMNPYLIGCEMWEDIVRRWDTGQHGDKWSEIQDHDTKVMYDDKSMNGMDQMFKILRTSNDWMFMNNYLTNDLVKKLKLYLFVKQSNPFIEQWVVTGQGADEIRQIIIKSFSNGGIPRIFVENGNYLDSGEMLLKHEHIGMDLFPEYTQKTLEHIQFLWGEKCTLETIRNKMKHKYIAKKAISVNGFDDKEYLPPSDLSDA